MSYSCRTIIAYLQKKTNRRVINIFFTWNVAARCHNNLQLENNHFHSLHTHAHPHTCALTHAPTHAHTLTLSLSLFHEHTPTAKHSPMKMISGLIRVLTRKPHTMKKLMLMYFLSVSPSISYILTHTHTHTHIRSLTLTLTHTHTHRLPIDRPF